MTQAPGRAVQPVGLHHADGLPLLERLRAALSGAGAAVAPHPAGTVPDPAATAPLREHEDDATDPVAAVVSTTGSTGRAKHVLLPASAVLASAAATHDHLGGSGTWLLAVPAHTVAGVQVLVRSLVAGTTPVVADLSRGFSAEVLVEAADRLGRVGGRRYTALVPTQLRRLLDAPAGTGATRALGELDAVLVGGAALDAGLRARALDAGVRVVSTYGMTETCGGCVYDGVPLPGVGVRVEPLPDGAEDGAGRVVLSGPVVARGYRAAGEDPDDAAAGPTVGEGFSTGPGGRTFTTADRGLLVDGRLVLHGRTDDVVVSGGTNVALDAVARVVRDLPDVADCVVVGLADDEWGHVVGVLLQPTAGSPGPAPDRVRDAVRRSLGPASAPRVVRTVDRVPLAGVGKPDRRAAADLLGRPADAASPRLGDHGPTRTDRPEEPTA